MLLLLVVMAEECTSLLGDRGEMNCCGKKYDITSGKVWRINKISIAIVGSYLTVQGSFMYMNTVFFSGLLGGELSPPKV